MLPRSRSVSVGVVATAFATIINPSATTAIGCRIAPGTPLAAAFDFQTTNPATNAPVGPPNTPVDIPAGGAQSFIFAFMPSAAFQPTEVRLNADCVNSPKPGPSLKGLNTILLSASNGAVPDVIALGATLTQDGIVTLDPATGAGVFAVATINLGAGAAITVAADVGTPSGATAVPPTLVAQICPTNAAAGFCLAAPAAQVTMVIGANETPTFGIFLATSAPIAFDPGSNRVFVNFTDADGVLRGSTSVAVHGGAIAP